MFVVFWNRSSEEGRKGRHSLVKQLSQSDSYLRVASGSGPWASNPLRWPFTFKTTQGRKELS